MSIINFGSLNIDLVYRVPHIVRTGETLASRSYATFAGGKGANQSIALARAGAAVHHVGRVGSDGRWLIEKLAQAGVDTESILIDSDAPTGHAVIQVDDDGDNAIVLLPGANHRMTGEQIDAALDRFAPLGSESASKMLPGGVLVQNEVNDVGLIMQRAARHGLRIVFNPAPMSPQVLGYPLALVDTLIVNETEACELAERGEACEAIDALHARWPKMRIILTRGERGVVCVDGGERIELPAEKVNVVDTTAAGDTFIGYYLAAIAAGESLDAALHLATRAAAVCVTCAGAMDSIPLRSAVR